ncbi:uncharacterized protein MELLADRAFT_77907 [Melampsora larici-populina 98AG31]|uniref:Myb-like domain-containing protein n=1 Tax=Melampsora larici-populina (strain 98AG31 / pathotype 3-4-7) TaxID=747676 RepID=F4RNA0_MELLP|nr:uncharacterized protein MELLADRAFT_77907 [Melampsora larici-populina 98AG31]EGG06132.1 hypothetical protein MELLADRAFT_77907 [Melampsora larici-populina 98AG31]
MPPKHKQTRPKRGERNKVANEVKPTITVNENHLDDINRTPSETSSPTPNPAQESVTSRPSGKSISLDRQRSASTTKRGASSKPMSNIQPSINTKITILNMCVDAFWSNVLSTPFESRELVEGSMGYQLSESEKSSWDAASAVQSMWTTPDSFIAHDETHDSACRDAILKYNLGSLFITFLTSPYEIGHKSIDKFLSCLIKSQDFTQTLKQEEMFSKFLIEYEVQKLILIGINKIEENTPSLFSDFKVEKKTLVNLIQLLDRNHHQNYHHQEIIPEFEKSTNEKFEEIYQSVHQSLYPFRNKPKKIAEMHTYTKFIELVIDMVCCRFPEYVRPTNPPVVHDWGESSRTPRPSNARKSQVQGSGKKTSHLVPGVRSSPRRSGPSDRVTSKEGPSGLVVQPANDEESAEDDDSSFCEDHLVPSSNRQDTSVPASYDGPSAGTAQARHHENVAGEVEATANFVNFAEGQVEKNPTFFSGRHSHSSSIPQKPDRQPSKQGTSNPSTSPKKVFNERKSNAKQIDFDETQTTIQEEVMETTAGNEDQQESEVSPKSWVESSARQPTSLSNAETTAGLENESEVSSKPSVEPSAPQSKAPQAKSLSITETTARSENRQGIEASPKSSVESSAPQPNSSSKDNPADDTSAENITHVDEDVEQPKNTSKDKGKGKDKEVKTSKSSKRSQPTTESGSRPKKQLKKDHNKSDDSDENLEKRSKQVKKPWKRGSKATRSRSKSHRVTTSSNKSPKEITSKHFEEDSSAEEDVSPSKLIKKSTSGDPSTQPSKRRRSSSEEKVSPSKQIKKSTSRDPSTKPIKRRRSPSDSSDLDSFSKATKAKGAKVTSPPNQKRRKRWTEEQEELLIEEVVKYCERYDCMAHILKRHGTNGSKSQLLADRTNVMLKDKAIQISTKWAREGTKLEKERRIAFGRFPPKTGEFRRMSSVSEEESNGKQSSKEEEEEDEIEDEEDNIIGEFASDESRVSEKKSVEEEEGNQTIHQVLNEMTTEISIYGNSERVINSLSSEIQNPAPTPKGMMSDERNVGMKEGGSGSQEDQIESGLVEVMKK